MWSVGNTLTYKLVLSYLDGQYGTKVSCHLYTPHWLLYWIGLHTSRPNSNAESRTVRAPKESTIRWFFPVFSVRSVPTLSRLCYFGEVSGLVQRKCKEIFPLQFMVIFLFSFWFDFFSSPPLFFVVLGYFLDLGVWSHLVGSIWARSVEQHFHQVVSLDFSQALDLTIWAKWRKPWFKSLFLGITFSLSSFLAQIL
jgi:hypothetical protein